MFKKVNILFFISLILLFSLTFASSRIKILYADKFSCNGNYISGWYWMTGENHKAIWKFLIPSTALSNKGMFINFYPLITNKVSGGSGFKANVILYVRDLPNPRAEGRYTRSKKVKLHLYNPFKPVFAYNSYGIGYKTFGVVKVPFEFYPNSYIEISLDYKGVSKAYPVYKINSKRANIGVNKKSLFISYFDM